MQILQRVVTTDKAVQLSFQNDRYDAAFWVVHARLRQVSQHVFYRIFPFWHIVCQINASEHQNEFTLGRTLFRIGNDEGLEDKVAKRCHPRIKH